MREKGNDVALGLRNLQVDVTRRRNSTCKQLTTQNDEERRREGFAFSSNVALSCTRRAQARRRKGAGMVL